MCVELTHSQILILSALIRSKIYDLKSLIDKYGSSSSVQGDLREYEDILFCLEDDVLNGS